MVQSFRSLIWLWGAVLSMSAVGATALQVLGPPQPAPIVAQDALVPALAAPVQVVAVPAAESARAALSASVGPALPEAASAPDALAPRPRPAAKRGESEDAPRVRSAVRRSPLAPDAFKAPYAEAASLPASPRYIGVYTTGTDGIRTFRSAP